MAEVIYANRIQDSDDVHLTKDENNVSEDKSETEKKAFKHYEEKILLEPITIWNIKHFRVFAQLLEWGYSGQEMLKICGIKRPSSLRLRWSMVYEHIKDLKPVTWTDEKIERESRTTKYVTYQNTGNLMITRRKLELIGVDIDENDRFELKKIDDNSIMLIKIK